ncbi:D-tyrosyl-tRNA(Tyr) deacylase [gamma proteobacterium HdN1]|nr:D-tyrosyl-tRNA(Tyr) deacylase [gamma proteobacterium HdN1]
MRALLQRVTSASVRVEGQIVGEIQHGLLVLFAVQPNDTREIAERMVQRIVRYRMFSDAHGKMNQSVSDVGGGILWVSQFTLAADTEKGLRPSFSCAAPPELARVLYEHTLTYAATFPLVQASGRFGADMQVALVNDGPVTFLLEVNA